MFYFLEMMFPIMFIIFLIIFILTAFRGIQTWNKNNNSPKLTVPVKVVTKRQDVTHHNHANAGDMTGAQGFHSSTNTTYYVTFQVESGDRIELMVSGFEYGSIVEGDEGKLTFQGTRFLAFDRTF